MNAPAIDPTFGCTPAALRAIMPPDEVQGFADFWRSTREAARGVTGPITWTEDGRLGAHRLWRFSTTTFQAPLLGGWYLEPIASAARFATVITHGYGGRGQPEPIPDDAAALFPCLPGFQLSAHPTLPDVAERHVVHGIAHADTYLLRACVAAVWRANDVLATRQPGLTRFGHWGGSFGGGIGALAIPWDERIAAGFLMVPTFGHHAWRLRLPCSGSGEAVRRWHATHPEVVRVLDFYDAAVAARHAHVPVLVAPADRDPSVPPPGQWAVANGFPQGTLFPLSAGHPTPPGEETRMRDAAWEFLRRHLA